MALPVFGALAGGVATAMYANAKYLLWNDLKAGTLSARTADAVQFITERYNNQQMLMYHLIEGHAKGPGGKNVFLVFEGREWTYAQFYADLQRLGNWLMNDLGIKQKEIVALDGGNTPEYMMLWFALDAIGACPAFINCNLTGKPLVHSVKLSDCRVLIAESERKHLVRPVEGELDGANIKVVYYDPAFIASLSDTTPIPQTRRMGIKPTDLRSLIYTSGTTGLPKGVIVPTDRELILARGTARYLQLKPGDRMYTALPLYHASAHVLCTSPTIFAGSAIVLSRKFSHKTFWPEVRASKANIIQYVGELCRYLVNAPPDPLDKVHNVKMAWGNGMRPDVWEVFRQRFGIEIINELYAATDGMGASFNANRGEFGRNAIAIRGLYWNWVNGSSEKRVHIDPDTQEILRDPITGFARVCKLGEAGEVIHKMDPQTASTVFAGYYGNKAASQKRFIKDVFSKGDLWFRSGDMMRQDADGRVYFVDRLGDTFRWHSENVSTNEVGDVLGQFSQIIESTVYGVQVPHADGRAGMAAIVLANGVAKSQLQLEEVAQHLISRLPRYAVPIFLRVVESLDYTETNKVRKGKLREEGIDVPQIEGNLKCEGRKGNTYWLAPGAQKYVPYAHKDWEDIKAGRVRL